MADVYVSIWAEDDHPDMLVKVTDICSTDPADPTYCATPSDLKLDRAKVQILYGLTGTEPSLKGDRFPQNGYWHLSKCWTNALYQPAYEDNWFAKPGLPNNFFWDVDATKAQTNNNQQTYAAKNWTLYPDGAEIPTAEGKAQIVAITDWVPGKEPAWAPITGGKGFGTPERLIGPRPVLYPGKSTALATGGSKAENSGAANLKVGERTGRRSSRARFGRKNP